MLGIFIHSAPEGYVAVRVGRVPSMVRVRGTRHFEIIPAAPCLVYSLLTYSMVQSPWEANWFATSQEFPRISRNPKIHYRTHKRPPSVSILVQPSPVHIPTSHLLEIHPNIIHPSTPRSPQLSHSLRFPQQDHIQPPLLTHTSDIITVNNLWHVLFNFE